MCMLVGCKQETSIQDVKANLVNTGVQFEEVSTVEGGQPLVFREVFDLCYQQAMSSIRYKKDSDEFIIAIISPASFQKITQEDAFGFQKDMTNLVDVGVDDNTKREYVFNYLKSVFNDCATYEVAVKLDLGDSGLLVTDAPIKAAIMNALDDVYFSATHSSVVENETSWEPPTESIDLTKAKVIPVSSEIGITNCLVNLQEVLVGSEAMEQVRGLSEANKNVVDSRLIFVEYSITNLSEESFVFNNKILSVTEDGYTVSLADNVVGLDNVKKLEPYVETTITDVFVVSDSGSLLWFDPDAKQTYLVDKTIVGGLQD